MSTPTPLSRPVYRLCIWKSPFASITMMLDFEPETPRFKQRLFCWLCLLEYHPDYRRPRWWEWWRWFEERPPAELAYKIQRLAP